MTLTIQTMNKTITKYKCWFVKVIWWLHKFTFLIQQHYLQGNILVLIINKRLSAKIALLLFKCEKSAY